MLSEQEQQLVKAGMDFQKSSTDLDISSAAFRRCRQDCIDRFCRDVKEYLEELQAGTRSIQDMQADGFINSTAQHHYLAVFPIHNFRNAENKYKDLGIEESVPEMAKVLTDARQRIELLLSGKIHNGI